MTRKTILVAATISFLGAIVTSGLAGAGAKAHALQGLVFSASSGN